MQFKIAQRLNKNHGLTLTELIVASMLIGIIMVGVIGFSLAVKEIQDTTSRTTILAMRSASIMSHIRRSAYLATGSQENPGIVEETPSDPANNDWISFRQDKNITPSDYSDDTWIIYIRDLSTDTLYTCEQTEAQGGSDPNAGLSTNCDFRNAFLLSQNIEDVTFELKVDPASISYDAYVEFTLDLLYSPATAFEPIENPRYSIETRITSPSHSWSMI